ncbi:MAG: hypothetical protein MJ231_03270 [bacterium]|nr:hypothetical protein [bacterium]
MRISPINSILTTEQKINTNKKFNLFYSTPINNTINDTVSFKGKPIANIINVPLDKAISVGKSLSTSTSGHRAPYLSENFTKGIVELITLGAGAYAIKKAFDKGQSPRMLIGGDTRQASRESLPEISKTLQKMGVNVLNIEKPVPTPLLAMAARDYGVDLAVLMTASHNSWQDGGYNLVTKAGAIAPSNVTQSVANKMVDYAQMGKYFDNVNSYGKETKIYPYELYKNNLEKSGLIDWNKIKKSGLVVYYDALNGTGQYVMPKLLEDYGINYVSVESSGQEGPNPTDKNLGMLKESVKQNAGHTFDTPKLKIGLSNDGDADRFGVVDENGNFVNANDVILLVGYHLAKNKGKTGAIIRSQATSKMLDVLADKYGLEKYETPVGFKYIAEDIMKLRENGKDILVAGEESGGLTVNGHIPEKDGIIALSLIMDLIATESKPLSVILNDLKSELGVTYLIDNFSKKVTDDNAKNEIMHKFEKLYNGAITGDVKFGPEHRIDTQKTYALRKSMEDYREGGDGIKLILTDGSTVLLRKSGTEPLIKCYIEAYGKTPEAAEENRKTLHDIVDRFIFAEN